jgi:tetratricopeptide (TPR) repeat protein
MRFSQPGIGESLRPGYICTPYPPMKHPFPLLIASLLAGAAAIAADKPLEVPKEWKPTPSTPSPSQIKYPQPYVRAVAEAVRAFQARDWPRTIAALDKADKILPPTPMTLNLRGALLIEDRKFDEGTKLCEQALKIDPKFYPARFNLAEIPLMQKNYVEARTRFRKFVEENPKDELARFRVFLTYLLERNYDDSRKELDQIPFPGDTPAYYFANASWEFAHDRADEAKKWLGRANWTFGPDKSSNFLNSLYEIGWIKREEPKVEEPKAEPPPPGLQLQQPPPAGAPSLGPQ